jgi:predicted O-linked N-acetylglucosamine transferase (SPINDLY family)
MSGNVDLLLHSPHPNIERLLAKRAYDQAIAQCEEVLQSSPQDKAAIWLLGLAYLLQGEEEAAQMTWLISLAEGNNDQVQQWTGELTQLLHRAAKQTDEAQSAWLIRQHLRSMVPDDAENIGQLLLLSLQLEQFTLADLAESGLIALLKDKPVNVSEATLLELVEKVFTQAVPDSILLDLVSATVPHITQQHQFVYSFFPAVVRLDQAFGCTYLTADITKICAELLPDDLHLWMALANFSQTASSFDLSIDAAHHAYDLASNSVDWTFISYLMLRSLLGSGGRWQEASQWFEERHSPLINQVVQEAPTSLNRFNARRLMTSCFLSPYMGDQPQKTHVLQNAVANLVQQNLQQCSSKHVTRYQQHCQTSRQRSPARLKVGYLCHTFRQHSVGWLARWLLKHHDRDRVEVYAYSLNHRATEDLIQHQFVQWSDRLYAFRDDPFAVADQIVQDEIDILIDLDSITFDVSYEIMSLKPAPVQVTWLAWDAVGMDTIDYFIADPYVLPAQAQDYYVEKIWRLPQTYIAVDGFEVGVPNLRRDQLDIPQDAIVFLTGQRGYKRNRPSVQLQIDILRQVPNSYLLIKGFGGGSSVQAFFSDIAEEGGVDPKRLRFLASVASELTHRANLAIADVVLDTYPYNGATTTLETLWMGIPLVARVGEQFAARNSYTLMINAGITEGIAWTDAEYVEWGVRLGKDDSLRQHISAKLRQARQTAPLWNTKQFAQNMEDAYEQMWKNFVSH